MIRIIAACSALFLAGCTHRDQCAGYGWETGTVGFAQCMQSFDMQDRALLGNYMIMQSAYRRY